MERRLVNVFISAEFIEDFLKTTNDCVIYSVNGLPSDSKMVNCVFECNHFHFVATMEHESFSPVKDGDLIPIATPLITRYHP